MKPGLLLAKRLEDTDVDPTGWWMSEKLDGVRAYWDGFQFYSRLGNLFYAPSWFTDTMPKAIKLDGELWAGRGQFQETVSIVRTQSGETSDKWKQIRYHVFDCIGLNEPFEKRMESIQRLKSNAMIQIVRQEPCAGWSHLNQKLKAIEDLGGEGVMLRQPGSFYETKRSSTLLKVKTFQDTEAEVIEHLPGAGKHLGRLGALLVRLKNGIEVAVGTGFSDWQRENPPKVGSTITFRYQGLTNAGVPRFPSYVGERID